MLNALMILAAAATAASPSDTLVVPFPETVVSATRAPRQSVEIPGSTAIITGDELRRRGTHTLAEALQDVVGLDTGEGSDNGGRLPNIGLWGLKEFDALLITLDGVPVGGPFNPSLSMIPVDQIDRIEIVKGPQGSLYGVSAFAGMVQIFSNQGAGGSSVTAAGGSFSQGSGSFGWGQSLSSGLDLRLNGALSRSDGWQDRTTGKVGRGTVNIGKALGKGRLSLDLTGYQDEQDWGTPLPYESGIVIPGFIRDRNYAVGGAVEKHEVAGLTTGYSYPLSDAHRLENTLGLTYDDHTSMRSFPGELNGDTLRLKACRSSPGVRLYEDVRLVSRFEAGGKHESVVGTALTWGAPRPKASASISISCFRRKATTFPPWIRSRSATTARSRTAAPSSALTRTTPGRRCGARPSPPAGVTMPPPRSSTRRRRRWAGRSRSRTTLEATAPGRGTFRCSSARFPWGTASSRRRTSMGRGAPRSSPRPPISPRPKAPRSWSPSALIPGKPAPRSAHSISSRSTPPTST
jgi:hypothetical protein